MSEREPNDIDLRQISLDTETTGLRPDKGDRVIEIGAVEIVNRRISDNSYHQYFDPQMEKIDPRAVAVHGLTAERLEGEPFFADGVEEFLEFVEGAELVIHNAPFDVGFIDAEMKRIKALKGKTLRDYCPKIIDTLELAQTMRPGQGNSLDDLRDFYEITDKRDLHGALIDARILAKVFLRMTGVQDSFDLNTAKASRSRADADLSQYQVIVQTASAKDKKLHDRLMKKIKAGKSILDSDFAR